MSRVRHVTKRRDHLSFPLLVFAASRRGSFSDGAQDSRQSRHERELRRTRRGGHDRRRSSFTRPGVRAISGTFGFINCNQNLNKETQKSQFFQV